MFPKRLAMNLNLPMKSRINNLSELNGESKHKADISFSNSVYIKAAAAPIERPHKPILFNTSDIGSTLKKIIIRIKLALLSNLRLRCT